MLATLLIVFSSPNNTDADLEYNQIQSNTVDVLDLYIDKLATCESGQIPDVVIVDTNGLKSYAWLQFQMATFNYYGEKYNLPHDDILDPGQQIKIAKRMIEDGGWKHWYICGKRIGLDKY